MKFEQPQNFKEVSAESKKANDPEKYKELSNVKSCERKLNSVLNSAKDESDIIDSAKMAIYKMLTTRSEFIKNTEDAGKNAAELMENFKPQMDWYKDTRRKLEDFVDKSGEFKWNSNPGWFGVNTRPEEEKREGISMKAYATIPVTEYSFIQHLPTLMKKLRELSLSGDDVIHIKIPESLSGFISHNDSIVVHYKNKENGEKILKILEVWMRDNGINESEREMGRTKIAADAKDMSFSDLVSKNIAEWLVENRGKYDNSILAKEAIKHAILQSQNSPI